MRAVATTTVTVYRGTTTNAFGDDVDNTTPLFTGKPMSIQEQRRATTRHADNRAQTVLYHTARCSPALDVRLDDRLLDERTGSIYLVTAASTVENTVTTNDRRLDLEKVST